MVSVLRYRYTRALNLHFPLPFLSCHGLTGNCISDQIYLN